MKKISYDDQFVISKCKELLKSIITKYLRYDIPPVGIVGLTKALYAISNYPQKVIDGYIDITVSIRGDGGMDYCSIMIASNKIELSTGGSVYNEGVGSDSFSDLFYSTSVSSEHDVELEIYNWIDIFNSYLDDTDGKLSIEDEAVFIDEEEMEEEE